MMALNSLQKIPNNKNTQSCPCVRPECRREIQVKEEKEASKEKILWCEANEGANARENNNTVQKATFPKLLVSGNSLWPSATKGGIP
jgi:hypothetical protein